MSYSDNIRSVSRPSCWGNSRSYDPNDIECSECRFKHSCSVEVANTGGSRVHVHTSPSYSSNNYRPARSTVPDAGCDAGTNKPAMIEPEETPVERFAKDALGGGLRGMFYEMWQFWRHYRIR